MAETQGGRLMLEQEVLIQQLLNQGVDLIEFIAEQLPDKPTRYLIEALFFVLREMGYFFTAETSPLFAHEGELTDHEKRILDSIKATRDAIGHRGSDNNYVSPHVKLVAGMLYKSNDVEIQYGETGLWLLADIIQVHQELRTLFTKTAELSFLSNHPSWASANDRLRSAIAILEGKLSDPYTLNLSDSSMAIEAMPLMNEKSKDRIWGEAFALGMCAGGIVTLLGLWGLR